MHAGLRLQLHVMLAVAAVHSFAQACPFCNVVGRTLSERRDSADAVVVAEADGEAAADASGLLLQRFRPLEPLKGGALVPRSMAARVDAAVRGTAVLFLEGGRWTAIAADEPLLAHVASAPSTDEPAASRLRWFAPRLAHPDSAIADDAFAEFGLAPFEAVREASGAMDAGKLRGWVVEPGVNERRRGFYGLALGLAATGADAAGRHEAIEALHAAVTTPADDFRAGFDGLLAGVLVAEREAGMAFIERQGLFGPTARPVDQRHLLSALRFAWEHADDSIPREMTAAATARLLAAPVVAADAVIDLARYRSWDHAEAVAALWDSLGADDPLVRRAVAGYLTSCPRPEASKLVEQIRRRDPERFEKAVAAASGPLAR